jgi:hypothetical protein
MKWFALFSFFVFILFSGCKTQKETVKNETQPLKKSEQYTDQEKQSLSQLEYIPEEHQKQLSPEAKQSLESLAREKADLTCKKKSLQKKIDSGEQVDPNEMAMIESLLNDFEKQMEKYAGEPAFIKYFEEKFNEFIQNCTH